MLLRRVDALRPRSCTGIEAASPRMTLALFQFARRDDPLANRKSARLWATTLPPNDAVGAIEAVIALVAAPVTAQGDMSLARAEALLELDRIADPMHSQLRAQ